MIAATLTRSSWISLLLAVLLMALPASGRGNDQPVMPDLELAALEEAVRWPKTDPQTIVTLAGRFVADHRDREAHVYFKERAASRPDEPLFLALEGFFQARTANTVPFFRRVAWVDEAIGRLDRAVSDGSGIARYFRGLVLAELPSRFGKSAAAIEDLEWVLQQRDRFPQGLRRSVHRGLARVYTSLGRDAEAKEALQRSGYSSLDSGQPLLTTDFWVSARDGFHFRAPRLVEMAPRVHVAQGFDFADIAFVVTDAGIVAIDAGTTEAHAREALAALRRVTTQPITHVILTHAHWDHIGGLEALRGPGTRVIAQASFADELRIVNQTGVPFRYFFGGEGARHYAVSPDVLVAARETLMVGGIEFVMYPARGGETADALLVYLPSNGVLFVGDVFMPYFGAPFLPEGSPEGFFETVDLIRSLHPRRLIHGHPPLTDLFTAEALPGFAGALQELYDQTLRGITEGRTLVEILHQNILPASLREHPTLVIPYLVARDNFVKRVHHQRTGYWKPDGEGIEAPAPREWAAALDLLAGERESAFVRSTRALLDRADYVLALKLADLALLRYPRSEPLTDLRRRALDNLRARHQQLNPFKFIIYSEWAGAALPPAE